MIQLGSQIRTCEHFDYLWFSTGSLRQLGSKYSFKPKKRKITAEEDEINLEESVRTISALFSSTENGIASESTEFSSSAQPLEARVASISAEIAAVIAKAQARSFEDDEEDEESGSGQEVVVPSKVGPNTSGIRGDSEDSLARASSKEAARIVEEEFEDEDSDAFPIPLRTRKTKSIGIGTKRKRWKRNKY
jgi:hypothetical protein